MPTPIRERIKAARLRRAALNGGKALSEVFHDIYEHDLWGKAEGRRYCSGALVAATASQGYEDYVARYLWRTPSVKTVLDIGCGDFEVARRLLARAGRPLNYVGCDIAGNVIAHNTAMFGNRKDVRFVELDATKDSLPAADLVLVREVFQHLSNADVAAVIANLRRTHDVAIVADSVTKEAARLNVDIASGDRPRTSTKSGIFVEATPFNLTLLDRRHEIHSSRIVMRTLLVQL